MPKRRASSAPKIKKRSLPPPKISTAAKILKPDTPYEDLPPDAKPKRTGPKVNDEERKAAIIKCFQKGMARKDIAKSLGITPTALNVWMDNRPQFKEECERAWRKYMRDMFLEGAAQAVKRVSGEPMSTETEYIRDKNGHLVKTIQRPPMLAPKVFEDMMRNILPELLQKQQGDESSEGMDYLQKVKDAMEKQGD